MDSLLKPIDNSTSSPVIYRHNQKFTCDDYDALSELLTESLLERKDNHQLVIDWTSTPTHPLIFEILLYGETKEENVFDFLMRYFDIVFLQLFKKHVPLAEAKFLLATDKNQRHGLRIHVLGVEISHDDYIHLCEMIQDAGPYEEEDKTFSAYLNIPSDFPLPSCDRPEGAGILYEPARVVNVRFDFYQENGVWRPFKLSGNEILMHPEISDIAQFDNLSRWKEMTDKMMPVPRSGAAHYVQFPVQIRTGPMPKGYTWMGQFKSYLNDKRYSIWKGSKLTRGKGFLYNFLKDNANHIDLIDSRNRVLNTWFGRFRQIGLYDFFGLMKKHLLFEDIDRELKKLCPHLKNESSPLAAVLKAHTLPVFYALRNITDQIDKIEEYFPFLEKEKLSLPPPKEAENLTFKTILYCAYKTGEGSLLSHVEYGLDWIFNPTETLRDHVGDSFDRTLKSTETLQNLEDYLRWVQQRAFPVVLGPDAIYVWNPVSEKWLLMNEPVKEMLNVLSLVLENVTARSGNKLSAELVKRFREDWMYALADNIVIYNLKTVNGSAMTEPLEMYGGNVPEYYYLNDNTNTPATEMEDSDKDKPSEEQ